MKGVGSIPACDPKKRRFHEWNSLTFDSMNGIHSLFFAEELNALVDKSESTTMRARKRELIYQFLKQVALWQAALLLIICSSPIYNFQSKVGFSRRTSAIVPLHTSQLVF
jgi:hypothetical protein